MNKWVVICNPKYYNVIDAFSVLDSINWKQSVDIQVGDIVYIYVGRPLSKIKYETKVVKANLSKAIIDDKKYVIDGSNYENYGRYMELKLVKQFDDNLFPFKLLKKNGLKSVQWPSRVSPQLEEFILNKTQLHKLEKRLEQELINEINEVFTNFSNNKKNYNIAPKQKPKLQVIYGHKVYPRDKKIAISALNRAKNECEIDKKHHSFIRRKTNNKYTEPHHLIPMAYQNYFENSLDTEANIVSLCSNCHNQIHYGVGSEGLIEVLYKKRKEELRQAGIAIALEDLLKLY